MYKKVILSFLFVFFLVLPFVGSHVCNDVLPGGSQYKEGCEPIIITVPGGASQDGNEVSLVINVENRQTPYSPATSCVNPWSSTLSNVRILGVTSTPSCSNCFSMNNPGSHTIPINTNRDYSTVVTINSGATPGTYSLKFEIKPGSHASRYVEISGVVVDDSCVPNCSGKDCGDDGCGGSCGSCSSGQTCSSGQCVDTCVPESDSVFCDRNNADCGSFSGSDNCGVSRTVNCGSCPSGQSCSNGQCVCTPTTCSSLGYSCGSHSDGCGGTLNCGSCPSGQVCSSGVCADSCVPESDSVFCSRNDVACGSFSGSDNCDVSRTVNCGSCASGEDCVEGVCVEPCVPDCSEKECGDDGCGGSCGSCDSDLFCSNNMCVEECTPDCSGMDCGDDGCGGSCGSCDSGETCTSNKCVCTPVTCSGLGFNCGPLPDGCGTTLNCGSCGSGKTCVAGFCVDDCVPDCSGMDCGDDGCGGSCGSCASGCSCISGVCDCSVAQDVNGEASDYGNDTFQVGVVDEIPVVDFDSEAENVSISGFEKFVSSSSFSYLFVFFFVVVAFSIYILYKRKSSSSSSVSSSSSPSVGVSSSNSGLTPSTGDTLQDSSFALLEREGITPELFENCKASILKMRSGGFSDEDIINKFVSSGWPREKVLLVLKFLK